MRVPIGKFVKSCLFYFFLSLSLPPPPPPTLFLEIVSLFFDLLDDGKYYAARCSRNE